MARARLSRVVDAALLDFDLMLLILKPLEPPHVVAALKACSQWRRMDCEELWKTLLVSEFPNCFHLLAAKIGWKSAFQFQRRWFLATPPQQNVEVIPQFFMHTHVYLLSQPARRGRWGMQWSSLDAVGRAAAATIGLDSEKKWVVRDDYNEIDEQLCVPWRALPQHVHEAATILGYGEMDWDLETAGMELWAPTTLGDTEELYFEAIVDEDPRLKG